MAVKLLSTESALLVAAGAADYAISNKVAGVGPLRVPWPVYYEAALILGGVFHRTIRLPSEVGDTALMAGLVLGGRRATALAMSGRLLSNPANWGGIGGEGGDGGDGSMGPSGASMRAPAGTRQGAYRPVGVRVLQAPGAPVYALPSGAGGSFGLYPASTESPGAAG